MSKPDIIYAREKSYSELVNEWEDMQVWSDSDNKDGSIKYISEAKHKEEIEQAREKTRQQCADAISNLVVSRMGLDFPENFISRADIDRTIRNSGQDKGEGV